MRYALPEIAFYLHSSLNRPSARYLLCSQALSYMLMRSETNLKRKFLGAPARTSTSTLILDTAQATTTSPGSTLAQEKITRPRPLRLRLGPYSRNDPSWTQALSLLNFA